MAAGVACRSSTGPLARRDPPRAAPHEGGRMERSIFVGIDWAEAHHDVCVLDSAGEVLAARRIPEGLEGVARLHALLGEHADEPDRGGRRHRDRPGPARGRPARGRLRGACGQPARGLALPRAPHHEPGQVRPRRCAGARRPRAHRPPAPSGGGPRQRAAWRHQGPRPGPPEPHLDAAAPDATRCAAPCASTTPAPWLAFADLDHPDALAVLAAAPEPERGRKLVGGEDRPALRKGGRQRNLERRASEIRAGPAGAAAGGTTARGRGPGGEHVALVAVIRTLNEQIARLEAELVDGLRSTPGRRDPTKSARTGRRPRRPGARGVRGCPRPLCRC